MVSHMALRERILPWRVARLLAFILSIFAISSDCSFSTVASFRNLKKGRRRNGAADRSDKIVLQGVAVARQMERRKLRNMPIERWPTSSAARRSCCDSTTTAICRYNTLGRCRLDLLGVVRQNPISEDLRAGLARESRCAR